MKKIVILLAVVVSLVAIGSGFYYYFMKVEKPVSAEFIDDIEGYNYKLEANATKLIKKEFADLKQILEEDEIDEEAYAKAISRIFVADLYTLNNKLNKYDVGGASYVFPSSIDNYKLNVQDTLYKYLEDNSDGKRKQSLPEVKEIEVISAEETKYEIDSKEYDGYKIKLSLIYEKDMGYDEEAEIILVKEDKYYYITAKN